MKGRDSSADDWNLWPATSISRPGRLPGVCYGPHRRPQSPFKPGSCPSGLHLLPEGVCRFHGPGYAGDTLPHGIGSVSTCSYHDSVFVGKMVPPISTAASNSWLFTSAAGSQPPQASSACDDGSGPDDPAQKPKPYSQPAVVPASTRLTDPPACAPDPRL